MTALTEMAAARPGGIAEARVPCPLCGGLIHPVAGRCKHCKEDLSSFRAGRPQAAAALPALNGKAPAPNGLNGINGTNGHAALAAVPMAVTAHEASQPILPPRTTARSVPAQRAHSMWRSWPMLVIVLAVIAIVAATVMMLMPPSAKRHDGKMSAPPAPERMETNPLPDKQSQADPWNQPGAVPPPRTIQPPPGTQPPPGAVPQDPDPQAQAQPDDDDDMLGGGGGVLGGHGASFMFTIFDHACKKLSTCPGTDQSALKVMCDQFAMVPKVPVPTNCPAAQRCLDKIDHLSCADNQMAMPQSVLTMFQDCTEATNC